jgi:antitoxin component HigA of HigAB toxin-antitoxin module
MVNCKIKIENEKDYNATIKKIDALMKKEENSLTRKEAGELWVLAVATYDYEEKHYYNSATSEWDIPQYQKV